MATLLLAQKQSVISTILSYKAGFGFLNYCYLNDTMLHVSLPAAKLKIIQSRKIEETLKSTTACSNRL